MNYYQFVTSSCILISINDLVLTRENDQQDAHFFSLIYSIKLSSTCFEQIIVHHLEVISVHAAYSILSCIYVCLAANTM